MAFPNSACASKHPNLLTSLQLRHLSLMERFGNVQAIQQTRRVSLRCITALVSDDSFKFPEPHAVLIGQLVRILRIQDLALLQCFPQRQRFP